MTIKDCNIGDNTKIWHPDLVNLYGCIIGEDCNIGTFVEIGSGVEVGNRCKIQSFCFIPQGVIIKDDVFIGPRVTFLNDKYPPSDGNWGVDQTVVGNNVSIGGGVIILPGIILEDGCAVGAGAVVTKNVSKNMQVVGVPAKVIGKRKGENNET